jgi:hypothetical protein
MNCKKLICYLSNDARAAYEKLIAVGIDNELAFTMVETIGGEDVYCLDDAELPGASDLGGGDEQQSAP